MSYSDHRYHAPTDLAVTATVLKRVLVIGSCLISALPEFIEANSPGCKADYILVNNLSELPNEPPHPAGDYDFQIIQIATRSILQEHQYFRLSYDDLKGYEALLESVKDNLYRILDGVLAYNQNHGMLTFISNFLVPQQNAMGRLLPRYDLRNPVYFFEQINIALHEEIARHSNVHVLDVDMISAGMGRKYVQDDAVWSFAHNAALSDADFAADQQRIETIAPISTRYELRTYAFVQAMWGEIVAMYRTLRQIETVKLVVVDLDDTLWRGVLAEHGTPTWDIIEGWPLGFAETLLYLKRRGVLLAILSKNDEATIAGLWDRVFQGLLHFSDFAVRKINWQPKVENFDEILAEVNLLPRSVVYVDDNPVERAAIQEAFPEVRLLGSDPYVLKRVLLWAPETQVPFITSESVRRTEMIQQSANRETQRKRMSRAEFLASLGLKINIREIYDLKDAAFPRAFELLNKTNQFNTTGRRWKLEEAQHNLADGFVWYGFEVEDNFTKYGLVSVAIAKSQEILQFVMSCRVVGLDVERAILAHFLKEARGRGFDKICGPLVLTGTNQPLINAMQPLGFAYNGTHWETDPNLPILIPAHIEKIEKENETRREERINVA